MKRNFSITYILFFTLCACGGGSGTEQLIENEVPVRDSFNYLITSDSGELNEVGNNSTIAQKIGQIEGINDFISLHNFTLNDTHIFKSLQQFNEVPEFFLLAYNRANKTTEKHKLMLPASIEAVAPAIQNLVWSEQGIFALLNVDVDIPSPALHLIKINPTDFSLSDMDIQVPFKSYTSMVLLKDKLYLSAWDGIWEVNLINGQTNALSFNGEIIGGSRLAVIDNNRLAFMMSLPMALNTARPVELNLLNNTYTAKGSVNGMGLVSPFGNGFYDTSTNEYINIISSNSLNVFNGLIKTNFINNTEVFNEIKGLQSSNRNLIVLEKLPL